MEGNCKSCKIDLSKVNCVHGEEKSFLGKKYWVYWCDKCYRNKFISMVHSSPGLLSEYIGIYGQTPEKVLR